MTTATKVKHTPGEWTAVKHDDSEMWSIQTNIKREDNDNTICGIWSISDEAAADARLIAAAPKLLDALIDLLYHVEDIPGNEYFDEKIFSNARKAINKATS